MKSGIDGKLTLGKIDVFPLWKYEIQVAYGIRKGADRVSKDIK